MSSINKETIIQGDDSLFNGSSRLVLLNDVLIYADKPDVENECIGITKVIQP